MPGKPQQQKGFTKEEEALLSGFSRDSSGRSSASFYVHALYAASIPIWIQARIHQLPVAESIVYLVIGTLLQAFALQFAYKNVKFVAKERIATARTEAVQSQVIKEVGSKINRQELDDRILFKKNEVAENESVHYSILYNNSIYICLYLLMSIVFFKSSSPLTNYIISLCFSSGVVALISNTK
jgi:translocon-associated protein subunit gamma